jgi:nucleoside-diphosphate-sugar epimerase
MTVLVTGARGDVGGAVLAGLAAAGEPVRASSRAPRPGEFPGGVEVARADLADPASWPARKVFLYAHPDRAAGHDQTVNGSRSGRRSSSQLCSVWSATGCSTSSRRRQR